MDTSIFGGRMVVGVSVKVGGGGGGGAWSAAAAAAGGVVVGEDTETTGEVAAAASLLAARYRCCSSSNCLWCADRADKADSCEVRSVPGCGAAIAVHNSCLCSATGNITLIKGLCLQC